MDVKKPTQLDEIERRTIDAQASYIAAFISYERMLVASRSENAIVSSNELNDAEDALERCRRVLQILIGVLGYVPKTFRARLPPEPGYDLADPFGPGSRRPSGDRSRLRRLRPDG